MSSSSAGREITSALSCDIGAFLHKIRRSVPNSTAFLKLIRTIVQWSSANITSELCLAQCAPLLNDEEVYHWLRRLINDDPCPLRNICKHVDDCSDRDFIQNLYTQPCPGSSYRTYHPDYVHPTCSGRTPLCVEVLNDTYVSYAVFRESMVNKSSSSLRGSSKEHALQEAEEDLLEIDVILDTARALLAYLECLDSRLSRMTIEERRSFKLNTDESNRFPGCYRLLVRTIYGDSSTCFLEVLLNRPAEAAPILMRRIKAKMDEWKAERKLRLANWNKAIERKYSMGSRDYALTEDGISMKKLSVRTLYAEADKCKEPFRHILTMTTEELSPHDWVAGENVLQWDLASCMGKCAPSDALLAVSQLIYAYLLRLNVTTKRFFLKMPLIIKPVMKDIIMGAQFVPRSDADLSSQHSPRKAPPAEAVRFIGDDQWYIFVRMFLQLHRAMSMFCDMTTDDIIRVRVESEIFSRPRSGISVPEDSGQCFQVLLLAILQATRGDITQDTFENTLNSMYGRMAVNLKEVKQLLVCCSKQLTKIIASPSSMKLLRLYLYERSLKAAMVRRRTESDLPSNSAINARLSDSDAFYHYAKNAILFTNGRRLFEMHLARGAKFIAVRVIFCVSRILSIRPRGITRAKGRIARRRHRRYHPIKK